MHGILLKSPIRHNKVKNAKLQTLRKSFETLQMKDSDFVDHFMTHVTRIMNQLCTHGEDIQEQKVIEKVL
jgi:ribosome assembly protein YihI (activator of Der GTPase)